MKIKRYKPLLEHNYIKGFKDWSTDELKQYLKELRASKAKEPERASEYEEAENQLVKYIMARRERDARNAIEKDKAEKQNTLNSLDNDEIGIDKYLSSKHAKSNNLIKLQMTKRLINELPKYANAFRKLGKLNAGNFYTVLSSIKNDINSGNSRFLSMLNKYGDGSAHSIQNIYNIVRRLPEFDIDGYTKKWNKNSVFDTNSLKTKDWNADMMTRIINVDNNLNPNDADHIKFHKAIIDNVNTYNINNLEKLAPKKGQ